MARRRPHYCTLTHLDPETRTFESFRLPGDERSRLERALDFVVENWPGILIVAALAVACVYGAVQAI